MEQYKFKYLFLFCFLSVFVFSFHSASALNAYTDKIKYAYNDTITVSGLVDSSNSLVNVTASFYNQSGTLINSSTSASSGSSTNTFSITNTLNGSYTTGNYYATVTDGTDTVNVSFEVIPEIFIMEAHLINASEIIPVDTSGLMTVGNEYGGNFSELKSLSLGGILHYGNATISVDGSPKLYHFVLVDQNYAGVYDTLYTDDDKIFQLYNDTEDSGSYPDTEKMRKAKEKFYDYIIGEIDFAAGNKVILGKPVDNSVYSQGQNVNFIVMVKNASYILKQDENVNVTLVDRDGSVVANVVNQTNQWGYFVSNITTTGLASGSYTIMLNNTPADVFSVETFRLLGSITDQADSPTYSFAANPVVRIYVTLKNSTGDAIDGATVSAAITYPNGSVRSVALAGGNGTYYNDVDMEGAPTGGYNVRISATYSGDAQEFTSGFAIETISLEVMGVNPQFIEEAEGPEAMIDSFAPNSNISLLVVLSNISAGGFMAKGPEGEGTIDIDNASTANDECSSLVTLLSIKDDRDVSLNLSLLNVQIVNLTSAINLFMGGTLPGEGGPPPGMLRQCMIVFSNISRSGMYRAEVKISHPLGEKTSGTTFSVQRLYATANPVDFKGDDFWFYAPNTTIRIKLKITDLLTRQDLPAQNITNAKIVEMSKQWPTYQDVFTQDYRATANETVANGTISFTSPNAEGFFFFKFKFKANLAGNITDGVGTGFFMLKKYMIWGQPSGCQEGLPCVMGLNQNITLEVKVVDISKGSLLDLGQSSGLTCTGCDGLEVGVNELWNDQIMKKMGEGKNYNVVKSAVNASSGSAYMNITPLSLPSGWYHADLVLTDPSNANNTYFGWAWFEIRNFWVDVMTISEKDGNLTADWSKGQTYGIGMPATFAVIAVDPSQMGMYGPQLLDISSISLDNINFMAGKSSGPPVPLTSGVDYAYTLDVRNVSVQGGPQGAEIPMWIVNITGLSRSGYYQANIRVNTAKGSDVGSAWFAVSKYQVRLSYRGMETWPSTFAPNENVTINVTACEFDEGCVPHNLSQSGTKIKSFWNQKSGNPIKPNASLTWTNCSSVNNCTLTADLSQLQGTGKFGVELSINDTQGNSKEEGFEIELRGMTVSIPNIRDVWVDQITETTDRELNVENDRDRCDNEKWVNWDQYTQGDLSKGLNDENPYGLGLQNNTCSGQANKVCVQDNGLNFTFAGGKPAGNLYGTANCLLNNGSMEGNLDACPGRVIYVVGNDTQLWFNLSNVPPGNVSNVIDMTGIPPKVTGDTFDTGNRNWTVNTTLRDNEPPGPDKYFTYTDTRLINLCTGGPDCTDLAVAPKNTSIIYKTNVYCVNATDWPNNVVLPCAPMQQVYIVSDATNVWISNMTDLTSVASMSDGQSLAGAFIGGGNWRILDIGKEWDGSARPDNMRVVLNWTYFVIDINDGATPAISVTRKYTRNFGRAFCVSQSGEWNDGNGTCDQPGQSPVFVVSNTTHLWFSDVPSVAGSQPKANGDTFQIAGEDWQVVNASYSYDAQRFKVKLASGVCGTRNNESCQGMGCQPIRYTIAPPADYSTIYHGYVRSLAERTENNDQWFTEQFASFAEPRPVYVYHNTTHVWINNTPVFAGAGIPVGGLLNDPYGGQWRVKTIASKKVTLSGINVVAKTGAWINTSLSKSGYIRISSMNEEQLGTWDKNTGQRIGVDIDGDGQTNSTVYFAVSDNASAGIYDTFFFASNSSNFSTAIPASANMAARTFGNGGMILLSIEPNGKRIRVYSNGTGDWGDLGEMKLGSMIKVPLLVLSPNGSYATANVSIRNIRREIGNSPPQMVQLSSPYPNVTNCNGLCEIPLNLSAVNPAQPQSGRYSFEITASRQGQADERMDEWRWPFVTMRAFLADSSGGEGGYVSGFSLLPLYRFDGETYGMMPDVYSQDIQEIGMSFPAVFSNSRGGNPNCANFTKPGNANQTANNWTLGLYGPADYWMYINEGNLSKVWIKYGNCNFTGVAANTIGNQINLTIFGHTYMFYVLDVNVTNGRQGVVIGLDGINPDAIRPLRNDSGSLSWRLMSLNLSGKIYDVLLANDTIDYPMCSAGRNIQECTKKAWFDTDGNFTNSVGVLIGQNFTSDLYLAKVGPGPWEGINVGNSSSVPQKPGIGTRISGDATSSRFAVLNEATIGLDLNRDGAKNMSFFMLAFDDRDDGLSNLTDNVVDDDLNMTEDWWSDDSGNYKDFYGDEAGMREQRNRLPWGAEWGNARFGEMQENVMYEQQPEWEIVSFNNTDMLLRKQMWWFLPSQNMTFMVRVYGFDQTPIANANVSVEKLLAFTPFGASSLNASAGAYSAVPSIASTNQYGWALISLRNSTWQEGNYMAQIKIETAGNVERTYNWFMVSSAGPGGP